jgi:Terminase RNaseH-like domain
MDFGWDHPFAAVELVHDRDSDVVYVSRTHRLKEATPVLHAATLRAWGKELPWAWPRDGNRETLEGAGIALAAQYRAQGLNLLHEFSHYIEGDGKKSVSVRSDGHARPDAERKIQGVQASKRLVGRAQALPSKGRPRCQRGRRPDGGNSVRAHDAEVRFNESGLQQLSTAD